MIKISTKITDQKSKANDKDYFDEGTSNKRDRSAYQREYARKIYQDPEKRAKRLEQQREYEKKRRQDPEKRAKILEQKREYQREYVKKRYKDPEIRAKILEQKRESAKKRLFDSSEVVNAVT